MLQRTSSLVTRVKFLFAKYPSLILFLVTLGSVVYALYTVLFCSHEFLLYNRYDQMRNYYAYLYYLNQPFSEGVFRFTGMNYPYGDFIFYTDNTPLIAIIVKIISHYIIDLTPSALTIYNWFMAISIAISAILIFKILNYFSSHRFINFFCAFCLAWFNPQSILINSGSTNLSLAMLTLASILLLIRIYSNYRNRKFYLLTMVLIVLQVASCFIHIYYLAVLGFCSGFYFLVWGINEIGYRRPFLKIWIVGLLQFLLTFGISFLIITSTDGYYSLRNKISSGYGWIDWKLNFSGLFTPYSFLHVSYLFRSDSPVPYSSYFYLGSFFLYLITFCAVLWVLKSRYRVPLKQIIVTHQYRNPIVFLLVTAIAGVMIAFGETYSIANTGITFINMIDAFVYAHWYFPMVTQFRVMARFAYYFFWMMNFIGIVMIVYAWKNYRQLLSKIVMLLLFFFLAFDAKNTIEFTKIFHEQCWNLYYRGGEHDAMRRLTSHINSMKYQAILPIPYYCVGSDELPLTIDPDDDFATACMDFSLQTGLPMMASSMGRTPPGLTKEELSLFLSNNYSASLKSKLNSKPILVLYNSSYYTDTINSGRWPPVRYEPAMTAFRNAKKFVSGKQLKKIAEEGDWTLFETDLKSF